MDSIQFAEFLLWKEHPSLDRSSPFLSRIYKEDIGPCLSFTRSEVNSSQTKQLLFYFKMWVDVNVCVCVSQLSQLVQSAVENNSLTIEPVAVSALPMVKTSAIDCGGLKWVKFSLYRSLVFTNSHISSFFIPNSFTYNLWWNFHHLTVVWESAGTFLIPVLIYSFFSSVVIGLQ